MKILIIDDSKAIHAFLKSSLNRPEIQLTHTFNGKEGFDEIMSKPNHYDIVLLDWEMPVQDGPTTLQAIRAAKIQTSVLMMTTKNQPEDIFLMLSYGANEYMLKPYTQDILFEKIEAACGMGVPHAA